MDDVSRCMLYVNFGCMKRRSILIIFHTLRYLLQSCRPTSLPETQYQRDCTTESTACSNPNPNPILPPPQRPAQLAPRRVTSPKAPRVPSQPHTRITVPNPSKQETHRHKPIVSSAAPQLHKRTRSSPGPQDPFRTLIPARHEGAKPNPDLTPCSLRNQDRAWRIAMQLRAISMVARTGEGQC